MRKYLENLIKTKEARMTELRNKIKASEDINEVRSIGETLEALRAEIEEAKTQLDKIDEPANGGNDPAQEGRALFNVATMQTRAAEPKKAVNTSDTEEYRSAFMSFCQNGTPVPMNLRADATTTTTDASAVIPTTIVNEIIKKAESYGNLYAAVRKMNVQGGVQIPILSLKPTATWITANTGTKESDKQKIQANTYISFNYYGLECRVAQTLLTNVTTLDMFQALFVELATEAIAKALDIAIMNGDGNGEPLGVTVDTRVTNAQKITLDPTEFASWSAWKKKVFAKIPKSYQGGTFWMAQGTFDGHIDGMVDDAGQPIGRVNYGMADAPTYRFGGKPVETVENDVVADYDTASTGDVVAVYMKASDYAFNSNMEMRVEKWIDHETNEIKNKVILIADGKLVDPNGVLIIKKGAAASA